eukprot:2598172-Amphidinium_carterae.1
MKLHMLTEFVSRAGRRPQCIPVSTTLVPLNMCNSEHVKTDEWRWRPWGILVHGKGLYYRLVNHPKSNILTMTR